MIDDPIVEEIRGYRIEHAKKFDNDPQRIFEDIKKREEKAKANGRKFISFPPRLYKGEVA